ncbi:hypothetical protein E4K10_22810 [Streptomyces sp. T1317-0309]|nr:hypothetical protein E4K10_22810 [Streptomyces sp. T1317-0309]
MWNLQREFESRDDHPYKYGYGMMMHGAYHYVDLATQILSLNAELFSERQLRLEVSAFGAFPSTSTSASPSRSPAASRTATHGGRQTRMRASVSARPM